MMWHPPGGRRLGEQQPGARGVVAVVAVWYSSVGMRQLCAV